MPVSAPARRAPTAAPTRTRTSAPLILATVVAGVVALVAYAAVSGRTRFAETGDGFPGTGTAIATPVGFFLGDVLAALTIGALLYVTVCARPDSGGLIGAETYRAHRIVERAAPLWFLVSVVMILVTAADRSGISVGKILTSPDVMTLVDATELSVAWIVNACCALLIVVVSRLSLTWVSHALLILPGIIGAVALPVAGNAGQGPDHDYTTGAVLVAASVITALVGFKIAAAVTTAADVGEHRVQTARRVAWISAGLESVALVYGAIVASVLIPANSLFSSAYGRWALIAGAALLVALVVDVVALRRGRRGGEVPTSAWTGPVGAIAGVAVLVSLAAMATRTAPGLLHHRFTVWDVFLGYELPHPVGFGALVTAWRLDLLLGVGAIVATLAYLGAVLRLRRRGVNWSVGRTISWVVGCAALLIVTSSGVRTYGMAMFSVHMGEHMSLNMFIPVLLVLGAPVTLALRTFPTSGSKALPGPREWLVWLVHSRFTQIVGNPVVALLIFVVSLYGVYFTPLFDTLARYHWGHELMSVHFLITGYLFYWVIIGVDPGPRRLPYLARLGLLFAIMPFHAFFGIATMTMNSILGGTFYHYLDLPWLHSLSDDQFLGGAIAWGSSEIPVVLVVVALVSQWARSDRGQARRADRRVDVYHDDDLDAYNRMLAELSDERR